MSAEVAPRPGGLEDDLAAILGIGAEGADRRQTRRRRIGLPVLAAGLLVATASAAILYVTATPRDRSASGEQTVVTQRTAESVEATAPPPQALPEPRPQSAGERRQESAAVEPPLPSAVRDPAPSSPARIAAAVRTSTAVASRTTDRSVPPAQVRVAEAKPARSEPAPVKAAAKARPASGTTPSASPREDVRTATAIPAEREQLASIETATAAPAEAVSSSDDRADRSARKKARRTEERKVLESLDAMRMLRRQ